MTRRRKLIIALAAAGSAAAVLAVVPLPLVRLAARVFPGLVWLVETDQPVAALTFDDGPHPVYTPQVLEILARHNARATFFLVGEHARQHPDLVARIRAAGHEIGNHTDSMATTWLMSTDTFEQTMLRAQETLRMEKEVKEVEEVKEGRENTQPQKKYKFLRPAGGWIRPGQLARARQHGYTAVLASAYAYDPYRPPAAYIRWVIAKNLRPGAIVALHDAGGNRSNTVAALEGILTAASEKGLRCVTLSELLAAQENK